MNKIFELGAKEGELITWRKPLTTSLILGGYNVFWFDFFLWRIFGIKCHYKPPFDALKEFDGGLKIVVVEIFLLASLIKLTLNVPFWYTKPVSRIASVRTSHA